MYNILIAPMKYGQHTSDIKMVQSTHLKSTGLILLYKNTPQRQTYETYLTHSTSQRTFVAT